MKTQKRRKPVVREISLTTIRFDTNSNAANESVSNHSPNLSAATRPSRKLRVTFTEPMEKGERGLWQVDLNVPAEATELLIEVPSEMLK